ncbi:translation initiation factor IF-2-like [Myotis myotis]|uniref:translation initiation factor IF-2-like n=1 Tax=Myotis myotis TaxID=51298 RepID=UPI0017483A5B|nr:translation initiation factor IF-2-like [Myotis myotis]
MGMAARGQLLCQESHTPQPHPHIPPVMGGLLIGAGAERGQVTRSQLHLQDIREATGSGLVWATQQSQCRLWWRSSPVLGLEGAPQDSAADARGTVAAVPTTSGGGTPSCSPRAGDLPGAPPLRPRVQRGKVAAAAAAPPPPSRVPPDSPRGRGARAAPGSRPARPAGGGGRGGGRTGPAGAGVVASRAPSHSLADQPRGRIAFKTSSSPPPGRAGGGRGAGRVRHHVPPESVRPHFLSAVPQLDLVPNSAPTFSLRTPTRPGPQTQTNFPVGVPDAGHSPFSSQGSPQAVGAEPTPQSPSQSRAPLALSPALSQEGRFGGGGGGRLRRRLRPRGGRGRAAAGDRSPPGGRLPFLPLPLEEGRQGWHRSQAARGAWGADCIGKPGPERFSSFVNSQRRPLGPYPYVSPPSSLMDLPFRPTRGTPMDMTITKVGPAHGPTAVSFTHISVPTEATGLV